MAMNNAAAAAYQRSKIQTASPAELTLMLYDGAIKFCNQAIMSLEKDDYEKCNYYIQKTKRIIVEFRSTLDFKYEVAKDFDRVYDYIYWVLTRANVKKDVEMLQEALKRIREMRDTWKEVMRLNKTETA
ncbi:MAG: flagellar export chaperone FliS [Lachnospiraceae bacterium]|jgi:flagellar protein FliS|nr:flagellar export chaperone FliS [Lachnospiraceae bacterium]